MTRRGATGSLVVALATAGGLVAHELAYRLAGVPHGAVHDYLQHLPLWLAVLALLALGAAGASGPAAAPRAWPFAAVGLLGFTVQEHLERLVHAGELPWLFDRPVFLLGLALQLPFALLAWIGARSLLAVAATLRRPAAPPRAWLAPRCVASRPAAPAAAVLAAGHPLRGPPVSL